MDKTEITKKTEAQWAAYRCRLSCKVGRDVIAGKNPPPAGCSALEYALFNLLHAMEALSHVVEASTQKHE